MGGDYREFSRRIGNWRDTITAKEGRIFRILMEKISSTRIMDVVMEILEDTSIAMGNR